MYIRRTSIKSRHAGEPYYTYRLVESVRTGDNVQQKTKLNLGRHFDVPREQWPHLVQRIEQIIHGQQTLFGATLDPQWEADAQQYAALIISHQADITPTSSADYQSVDVDSVELLRPRSVGVEHVALSAIQQLGFDEKLTVLGFNGYQCQAALANIIGRMASPSSELATQQWLQQRSGLGELTGYDFNKMNLQQLYRASDKLYANKTALESFLFQREKTLFNCDEVITLYDLTNTYFEGTAVANDDAAFGRSKEKRSDCPLVTLALVLDSSGFPKRSEIFPGNASETKTLADMVGTLTASSESTPTVVLDAGIASEANIDWLVEQGYGYVVVSRKRHRQFDETMAQTVKATDSSMVKVQRVDCADRNEVELYCHSQQREDRAIAIHWKQTTALPDTLPGVYCLRTNQTQWEDRTLWETYTMLTDLEAVFRSLKSELGLRPVYHHKKERVSGHLFISVLAYHFVHSIRIRLKACGTHLSWEGLRRILMGQQRVTVQLRREDGKTLHLRKTTRAEQQQQTIYNVLGMTTNPGRTEKTVID